MCLCSSLFSPGEEAAGHACACVCVCVADGCSSESKDVFCLTVSGRMAAYLFDSKRAAALINIAVRAMALLQSLLHDSQTDHETIRSAALLLFFTRMWDTWAFKPVEGISIAGEEFRCGCAEQGPGFYSRIGIFLWGVFMFCLGLYGCPPGSLDSPQQDGPPASIN